MRWHILRTLLHKELLRNSNRGALALMALLVVMATLLSFFSQERRNEGGVVGIVGGVQRCYVYYWQESDWVRYLQDSLPEDWQRQERVVIQPVQRALADPLSGKILYPQETGGIEIRPGPAGTNSYVIWFYHPDNNRAALAPYESWFWRETRRYYQERVHAALKEAGLNSTGLADRRDADPDDLWVWTEAYRSFQERANAELGALAPAVQAACRVPDLAEVKRQPLAGGMSPHSAIASALVLFALFFSCVYNMPSLTCEERERGILLAQALSPASPQEIVAAKYLFYPAVGMSLATLLAGIYRPAVLAEPFFWLALLVASCGSIGVGMTIAALARTQRAASMGALCYTLAVTLFIVICEQSGITFLPWLTLEMHVPRMFHAVLSGSVLFYHWLNLAAAAGLALVWTLVATHLFRKRGWQ
jgi:hypothetical protein